MTLASIPLAGGALEILWSDSRAHLAARAAGTMDDIVEVTGFDELRRRMQEDPEVSALFTNAVDSAMRTGFDAKRRLLGRIVSAAVLDESKTDESTLIYLAVRDLEAVHLLLLERLARAEDLERKRSGDVPSTAFRHEHLEPLAKAEGDVVDGALKTARLTFSSGYVMGEGFSNEVTEFGRAVLSYLRAAEE